MILLDVIKDAERLGDSCAKLQVMLATRTVNGQELDVGQVQTSEVGKLQIDPAAQEIDLLPTKLMPQPTVCLTISDILVEMTVNPVIENFALAGVERIKQLTNGRTAQLANPLIGTYVPATNDEIWLLHFPASQSPDSWFFQVS